MTLINDAVQIALTVILFGCMAAGLCVGVHILKDAPRFFREVLSEEDDEV